MGKSEILKYFLFDVIILKWNTCVISSDPPFIEWHHGMSDVPLKPLFVYFNILFKQFPLVPCSFY